MAAARIELLPGAPRKNPRRLPRAAAQQWALGYFSTDFLTLVADSRRGRAGK